MLISLVVYCLLGAIAGVLAGLLGVGGGIVIVPMLVFAFGWQNFPPDVLMLMALGTSMGSIMFTSISSSLAHSRNKGVQWDAVRNITPGILIGTFCGSFLASHVPARFLQLFFVAFLFFVITQMLSGKKPKPSRHLPGLGGMSVAGGIIGVVSSLVGIGGGTLSGLSELITGVHQYALIRKLCQDGDLSQIDLTIGDMSKGKVGTLPPEATAANFAKLAEDATSADKMRGLVNLVLQAIGTMSVLACRTCGTNTVVLTGALTMLPPAHETFELFTQLYGVEYIIPENATFATAIGAALYSMREDG